MFIISNMEEISNQLNSYKEKFNYVNQGKLDINKLQQEKLMKLVKEALKAPMYQEIYSAELQKDILECKDPEYFMNEIFKQLPVIDKKVLLKYAQSCSTIENNMFLHYYESSGTTGIPVPASKTIQDFIWNTVNIGEMWNGFLSSKDIAIILINAPFAPAPYQMEKAAEYVGMMSYRPFVDNLTGDHSRVLRLMSETNTNVFIGPGSGLIELYEYAAKNKYPKPYLKKVLLLGEQTGPSLIHRIEKLTGAWVSVGTYGSSETATISAACKNKELHAFYNSHYLELFDGQECKKPSEQITTGELVVTTLDFLSKPLIKYNTGDIVKFDFSPCKCGSFLPKINTQGRAIDIINFDKNNVTQEKVENVIWDDGIENPSIFNYMLLSKEDSIICFFTSEYQPSIDWEDGFKTKLSELFTNKKVSVKNVEKLPALNSLGAYVGWKLSRVLDLSESKGWARLAKPIRVLVEQSFEQLKAEMKAIV